MLTKIFINGNAYEVNLLEDYEVIKQIHEDFIGKDNVQELEKTKELESIVAKYIDHYEKVIYKEKSYFILKSKVPINFNQKTYGKTYIPDAELSLRYITAILLPITFIVTNIFDAVCNIKNMINSRFGSTKINKIYTTSESIILILFVFALNILFFSFFKDLNISWYVLIIQAINIYLAILKPIKYHYNQIENYSLSPYTFDSKYENISNSPIERLQSMKTTEEKRKIEFDFTKEEILKEKDSSHATY